MTVILSLLFIASLVQSIAGFGFGMMFVPLGLMLLEPSLVVPVSVISSTCLSAILVATHYKKSRFKQCLPMLIAGILTTPIGAKALVLLNGDLIKLGIALLMIITSIAMIKGLHILIAKEKLGFIIVGLMSGFVGGLCGIGAPPVVLFLVNQNIKKEVFRANMMIYFFIISFMTSISYYFNGLITEEIKTIVLYSIPVVSIGFFFGLIIHRFLSEDRFKKVVLFIVLSSAILLLIQLGVLGLF